MGTTKKVTRRASTRSALKQVTIRPGRWFTARNGQLIKALSTRGISTSFPIVGGIYDAKKRRLVGVQNFSPKGVIQGGALTAPLNIVGPAVAPKMFAEKNLSFNVSL